MISHFLLPRLDSFLKQISFTGTFDKSSSYNDTHSFWQIIWPLPRQGDLGFGVVVGVEGHGLEPEAAVQKLDVGVVAENSQDLVTRLIADSYSEP